MSVRDTEGGKEAGRELKGGSGNNKDASHVCLVRGLIKHKLKVTTESNSCLTFAEGQLTGSKSGHVLPSVTAHDQLCVSS